MVVSTSKSNFNAPNLYADNMNISVLSNTTLSVSSGQVRDQTNSFDIPQTTQTIIDGSYVGINGLDDGTLAASTWYGVYALFDQTWKNPPAFVISRAYDSRNQYATGEFSSYRSYGYSLRIGWVRTDSSAHFIPFIQTGNGKIRNYQWLTPVQILNAGASTTFATINVLYNGCPSQIVGDSVVRLPINFRASYTPAAAADTASIRPTGSAVTAPNSPIILKNSAAAQENTYFQLLPGGSNATATQEIDYIVTTGGSLSLWIMGFQDYL